MSIWEGIGKQLGALTQEAKKTYDARKLEQRIKSYRKEENELYAKLGRMLYQARGKAGGGFDEIYDHLDAIRSRMKHLDRQITDIRAGAEGDDFPAYQRLDRKERDLTITRTDEGIRLIRVCPACKTANSPANSVCSHCGRGFGQDPAEDGEGGEP